jgi:hypothetical protein
VVNLHSYNGQPGGAVDIYPTTSADLAALGVNPVPLVSGLAYGQASDPLQPGGRAGAGPSGFGLAVRPHAPSEPGSANLKIDITNTTPPSPGGTRSSSSAGPETGCPA